MAFLFICGARGYCAHGRDIQALASKISAVQALQRELLRQPGYETGALGRAISAAGTGSLSYTRTLLGAKQDLLERLSSGESGRYTEDIKKLEEEIALLAETARAMRERDALLNTTHKTLFLIAPFIIKENKFPYYSLDLEKAGLSGAAEPYLNTKGKSSAELKETLESQPYFFGETAGGKGVKAETLDALFEEFPSLEEYFEDYYVSLFVLAKYNSRLPLGNGLLEYFGAENWDDLAGSASRPLLFKQLAAVLSAFEDDFERGYEKIMETHDFDLKEMDKSRKEWEKHIEEMRYLFFVNSAL